MMRLEREFIWGRWGGHLVGRSDVMYRRVRAGERVVRACGVLLGVLEQGSGFFMAFTRSSSCGLNLVLIGTIIGIDTTGTQRRDVQPTKCRRARMG